MAYLIAIYSIAKQWSYPTQGILYSKGGEDCGGRRWINNNKKM